MSQTDLRQESKIKTIIVLGVILISVLSSGWMLSQKPLEGHECFVTVTAREMLRSGDWIVPEYNGEVRLQKTPLNYWLVAITSMVTGETDEFSARLPSVVLAVLSAVAILYFVSQWLGFRTGVLSALVWSSSLGFIRYGRSARPEMSLTCFMAIAFLSFYTAVVTTDRKKQIGYMLVFWISCGMGMLAKGPAPLPLLAVPLLGYFVIFRKWKTIPKLLPVIGVVIFLAITIVWPVLVVNRLAAESGEAATIEFWKTEFVGRFMGTHDAGDKPIYYYLPHMFTFMLPWVAFVPMALGAPFYKLWGEKQKAMLFLWLWFVGNVVVMSISGGKRMHYIFPAMPAMAILTGIILDDLIFTRIAYTDKFARNLLCGYAGAVIAMAVGGPIYIASRQPEMLVGILPLAVSGLVWGVVTVWLFAKRKKYAAITLMFGGLCGLFMISFPVLGKDTSFNRNAEVFAKKVVSVIPSESDVAAYKEISARFVHHYGQTVAVEKDIDRLFEKYEDGDWIVATGSHLEKVVEDGRFAIVERWGNAEREGDEVVDGAIFHGAD